MIGRIWKMLRFQTQATAIAVNNSAASPLEPRKIVSCIKLQTRLGRQNSKHPSGGRFVDRRGRSESTCAVS